MQATDRLSGDAGKVRTGWPISRFSSSICRLSHSRARGSVPGSGLGTSAPVAGIRSPTDILDAWPSDNGAVEVVHARGQDARTAC